MRHRGDAYHKTPKTPNKTPCRNTLNIKKDKGHYGIYGVFLREKKISDSIDYYGCEVEPSTITC